MVEYQAVSRPDTRGGSVGAVRQFQADLAVISITVGNGGFW